MLSLSENKKFSIILTFLVAITVISLLALLQKRTTSQTDQTGLQKGTISQTSRSSSTIADDPLLRQPGGYHYDRVQSLVRASQKKINTQNPALDLEICRKAYFDYYSRQSEADAANALAFIHNCEK